MGLLAALGTALRPAAAGALQQLGAAGAMKHMQKRGMLWSVEREQGHTYKDCDEIINHKSIEEVLEGVREPYRLKT